MFRHLKSYYEYFVFTQSPWVEYFVFTQGSRVPLPNFDLGSLFSSKSVWISLSFWVEEKCQSNIWLGGVAWRRRWVRQASLPGDRKLVSILLGTWLQKWENYLQCQDIFLSHLVVVSLGASNSVLQSGVFQDIELRPLQS